jgi:small-conductance mechanosensitive channel
VLGPFVPPPNAARVAAVSDVGQLEPWRRFLDSSREFGVNVVVFLVVFVVLYLAARATVIPLTKYVLEARDVNPTIRRPTVRFVRAVAVFVAALAGLSAAELTYLLSATAALAAATTIAIGFASRDILGNLVSGLFIIGDPKFNIGDWISWEDRDGVIEDISFRVTRVRTFDNEIVTVPNSQLASSVVTNHVANEKLRLTYLITIPQDADVEAAKAAIIEEAQGIDLVLDDPLPTVRTTEFAKAYIGLNGRFWIAEPNYPDFVLARSEFLERVNERFAREGIESEYEYQKVSGSVTLTNLPSFETRAPEQFD